MAKLYFRYGAVGCGKSAALLQVAHNYESVGGKVLLLKAERDTKEKTRIESGLGINRKATPIHEDDSPWEFFSTSDEYDCILVDEAQFLTVDQVDQLHNIAVLNGTPVICYGLRTNYKLEDGGFEGATRLLQVAEEIEEIKTVCKCGHKATCNARFIDGAFQYDGGDVIKDKEAKVEHRAFCYRCYSMLDIDYNGHHTNGSHLPKR